MESEASDCLDYLVDLARRWGPATEALLADPIAAARASIRSVARCAAAPDATAAVTGQVATIALETTALAFAVAILGGRNARP